MATHLYKPKNHLSTAIHYGATAALALGSFALGGPLGIAAAIALTGGISYLVIKEQKKFLENHLVEHPDVHEHSPNLGKIADEFYKKTGLSATEHPLYDFRADPQKSHGKKSFLQSAFEEAFETMGETHNAAALNLGKPVIMISEPLLKLLDDEEERAVLAHEFTHAAAHHQHLGIPQKLLGGIAVATNAMTMIGAWWSAGIVGIISSAVARTATGIGSYFLTKKFLDKDKLLSTPSSVLDLDAAAEKKDILKNIGRVSKAASVAVLTYFNPVYLGLYAATRVLNAATKVIGGAFSRSMEYQADEGAVALGADPLALATGLRKIEKVVENSKLEAFDGKLPKKGSLSKAWAKAVSSHPSTENRVKRLAEMAKKQGVEQAKIDQAAFGKIEVSNEHNLPYHVIKQLAHGM